MPELFLGGRVDPATGERSGDEVRIKTDELTTHGVIVGMTGSGKTGLGVVLIEEVLRAGLPALLIDPKGDLTNLALTFPDLAPADFLPWIDESQATAAGQSPDEFAAAQATAWSEGLGSWNLGGADVAALRSGAPVTIYTPGSRAGVPVNIVGALTVPADGADPEVVADEIEGYVTGLLNLVGIAGDPLSSREHILLSNLIDHAWGHGHDIDLPTLVSRVQQPPIRKLGVLDLDEFYPAKDRTALATKLNGLLASPSFAAWSDGPPLDVASMLYAADGSPRCAVITTAHLSDDERQFVTSLVLSKLITWMRRQTGTSDLRMLLYMDEVAGYLPPTANPPTKKPVMTLMKQARAFGVGVVLSTQNPVDIDYKAISNAGTWMIGRLQTEQDKKRLLDGMSSAAGGVDTSEVADSIAALGKRQFVVRRAKADAPELLTTRWAMSYLRGPMTRDQIGVLMGDQAAVAVAAAAPPRSGDGDAGGPAVDQASPEAGAPDSGGGGAGMSPAAEPLGDEVTLVMPKVADGTVVRWVDPAAPWLDEVGGDGAASVLQASLMARVVVRYSLAKADLTHDEEYETVVFPLTETTSMSDGLAVDFDDRDLRSEPPDGASYHLCRASIGTKAFFAEAKRELIDHLASSLSLEVPHNAPLKLWGRVGETDDEFAERCQRAAAESADAEVAKLRGTYETKVRRLSDQLAAAEDRVSVLAEEAKGKRNSELLSTAGSVLGGILGGRRSAGAILGQVGTAAGRRGRTQASEQRVRSADAKVERLAADLDDLEAEATEAVEAIADKWDQTAAEVTTVAVAPTKTNVKVVAMCLAWIPADSPD